MTDGYLRKMIHYESVAHYWWLLMRGDRSQKIPPKGGGGRPQEFVGSEKRLLRQTEGSGIVGYGTLSPIKISPLLKII